MALFCYYKQFIKWVSHWNIEFKEPKPQVPGPLFLIVGSRINCLLSRFQVKPLFLASFQIFVSPGTLQAFWITVPLLWVCHIPSPQRRLGRSSKLHLLTLCVFAGVNTVWSEGPYKSLFGSLPPTHASLEQSSARQAWWQTPLIMEPSQQARKSLSCSQTRSHDVVQHGLNFKTLLPQPDPCRNNCLCHYTGQGLLWSICLLHTWFTSLKSLFQAHPCCHE